MSFLESLLFGLVSGLTDILPVSAQAHKAILLAVFGVDSEPVMLRLLIHAATLAALYVSCQKQILRISRQLKLARIPKKRRKRPVDMKTLLDYRMMQTMVIPVIIGFLCYGKTAPMGNSLSWCAVFLLLNAVILFLPRMLPSGNKDSRSMSRLESVVMGLGGALGVFPGISSVGCMTAVGSVCGAERTYALNVSLMMNMVINGMLIFHDLLNSGAGFGGLTFGVLMGYLVASAVAFAAVYAAIRLMQHLASGQGYTVFVWYSLAMAMLMFIIYLMV